MPERTAYPWIDPPPPTVHPAVPATVRGFIDAMANLAAAVSVVTAIGPDRTPVGATVTSAVSISAEPPIIGVSLGWQSRSLAAIRACRCFAVNILRSPGRETARLFGTKSDAKFDDAAWEYTPDGLPWFPTLALAAVTCHLLSEIPAGDHMLLLGAVDEVHAGTPNDVGAPTDPDSADPSTPLVYWQRGYRVVT